MTETTRTYRVGYFVGSLSSTSVNRELRRSNAFDHIPAAVIGASIGQIGTAVAQQSLRGVLSFCNARQMTAPEAYITYSTEVFTGDGAVADESVKDFLTTYMAGFRDHIARVLTVLPR